VILQNCEKLVVAVDRFYFVRNSEGSVVFPLHLQALPLLRCDELIIFEIDKMRVETAREGVKTFKDLGQVSPKCPNYDCEVATVFLQFVDCVEKRRQYEVHFFRLLLAARREKLLR